MRNLAEFPVTLDEVIECLRHFISECDPELIGDMRPLLLHKAMQIVQREKFLHGDVYPDDLHPSHQTRISDASSFDEICVNCGATDIAGGGWGRLKYPCPSKKAPESPAQSS